MSLKKIKYILKQILTRFNFVCTITLKLFSRYLIKKECITSYGDMFPFYDRLLGCIHDAFPVISPMMDTYWYSGAPPPGHQSFQVYRSASKNC